MRNSGILGMGNPVPQVTHCEIRENDKGCFGTSW